jgi:peptidoglycan/xylan/chitin deacetylase (PgdA/CDA1 family)
MSDSLVLCYHAVSERWPAPLSVTPANLEQQLGLLVARGYRGVTFGEIASGRAEGRVMCVTFDDAFRSVIERALPIMEELGVPGTVFAPTSFVGRPQPMAWPGIDQWLGGEYEPELACMSWDELGRLTAAGWEVGSHTRTHPRLTQIAGEQLRAELEGSRADCEEGMGEPCTTLAYPYGDWDARVASAAEAAGYAAACTLPARLHRAAPLSWPRVGVYHADDMRRFKLKVSPAMRRVRSMRVWELARRVR